jgi:hypothetical protein
MPDFTAVDPDVLDEAAAYGPEPDEDRSERLARAFEHGATLRLDAPPITGDDPTDVPDDGGIAGALPRMRRGRGAPRGPRTNKRAVGGAQLGDLFMAGFSIAIGFAVGEWAAPSDAEAKAIAAPLGNILARRIDLASKLGKDTDDVVNLAIALMAYFARIGPIAAGRATDGWKQRNARRDAARVDRPPAPIGATDDRGTSRVDARRDGSPRSPLGAAHSPRDALAAVAANGLGYLDRNLSGHQGQSAPVVD